MTTAPVLFVLLAQRINWTPVVWGALIAGVVVVWGFAIYGAVVAFGGGQ